MKQPCIECGKPADGTRCTNHATIYEGARRARQEAERKRRGGRPQYGGAWQQVSRAVRATATVCWLCGDGPRADDPWQADHVLPAQFHKGAGAVRAAHRSCNIARGNRTRHQQPNHDKPPPTAGHRPLPPAA